MSKYCKAANSGSRLDGEKKNKRPQYLREKKGVFSFVKEGFYNLSSTPGKKKRFARTGWATGDQTTVVYSFFDFYSCGKEGKVLY